MAAIVLCLAIAIPQWIGIIILCLIQELAHKYPASSSLLSFFVDVIDYEFISDIEHLLKMACIMAEKDQPDWILIYVPYECTWMLWFCMEFQFMTEWHLILSSENNAIHSIRIYILYRYLDLHLLGMFIFIHENGSTNSSAYMNINRTYFTFYRIY